MDLKDRVKSLLVGNPKALDTAGWLYENCLQIGHILSQDLKGNLFDIRTAGRRHQRRQAIMKWRAPFRDDGRTSDLIEWLRLHGVRITEGGHTFYIAPQEALLALIPAIVKFYPDHSGFKILKDFRHPLSAKYLFKHRRWLMLLQRLIGTPQDQLASANYMHSVGIGPRVWDLTCWEWHRTRYTVFVVDHIEGTSPSERQCSAFVKRLEWLIAESDLRVLVPRWQETPDFMPPDCNKNLIQSASIGRCQYVDFQNFGIRTRSGQDRRTVRSESHSLIRRHLTPDVPREFVTVRGCRRRQGRERSLAILAMVLETVGTLTGRVVLEMGCGDGDLLHESLVAGAAWAVGWDRADVISRTRERLFSLGTTRFSLIADEPTATWRSKDELPGHLTGHLDGAVVVCTGSSEWVDSVPMASATWSVLVCDRTPSNRLENSLDQLRRSQKRHLEVVATRFVWDGRRHRPIVAIRQNPSPCNGSEA